MLKIFEDWLRYWTKRKLLFSAILVLSLAVFFILISRLTVHQDITKTLPNSQEFNQLKKLIDNKGLNNKIIFTLPLGEDLDSTLRSADLLVEELNQKSEGNLHSFYYEVRENENDLFDAFYLNTPLFLSSEELKDLEEKLNRDSILKILAFNHEKLYSSSGIFYKNLIFKDPLGLTLPTLGKLNYLKTNFNSEIEDGLILTPDGKALFIIGQSNYLISDSKGIKKASLFLKEIQANWLKSGIKIEYFSGFLVAAENAIQVQKDMYLTLTITIISILLILFLYYRSFLLPLYFLIPAVVGLSFSLAMAQLIKGEISGISVAAGAVIIGIIMDYSFHFFSHLKKVKEGTLVIKDIAAPLALGSLTTILAFAALIFTNSVILQDFGFFASLSLVGAILTVLFILPVIVPANIFKNQEEKTISIPQFWKKTGLYVGVILIVFGAYSISKLDQFQFENDLDKLNFHPTYLKEAEENILGKDPVADKNVYVFSIGTDQAEVIRTNQKISELLEKLYVKGDISAFLSTGFYKQDSLEQNKRLLNWKALWQSKSHLVNHLLDSMSQIYGYNDNAFNGFKSLQHQNKLDSSLYQLSLISNLEQSLVVYSGDSLQLISSFTADKNAKESVKAQLLNIPGVQILDNNSLTTNLVQLISDDFNYILLVTSLLVFVILLITYGRIEIALATFFPMVISWLCIIGLAVLLDIKLNFVNIVITTFIFGLGDDFAIFITDAYLAKYKDGKDKLSSYTRSILLSSLTTLIGTGVLLFAEHPALKSIGLLAVIGMLCIVLVSFTIQPLLFRIFLINRTEKGKAPITAFGFVVSVFAFSYFLFGCILLFLISLIFRLIPFGQKHLRHLFRSILSAFAWSQIHVMANVKKQQFNRTKLSFESPQIIISNHQSFIDILSMVALHPKLVIMTNDWVYNSPFFGSQIRYAGYLQASKGIDNNLEAINKLVEDGISIVIFPEGTRSADDQLNRFHKGAFYLSEKTGLPIQPILLHGFNETMAKNDFLLKNGRISVVVLPTILANEKRFGEGYKEKAKNIRKWYQEQMLLFKKEHQNTQYIFPKIISNYIYKGPFIEWYVRIKWQFEKKNYELYDELAHDAKTIYDIGCGLGYMSYYLKERNPNRNVIGIDYDSEKIELADHCYTKSVGIQFLAADITEFYFAPADTIFCMDVLHYLTPENQEKVLKKLHNSLNPKGKLVIRDGVVDLGKRHQKTENTEKYSTRIIKFNKTTNDLHFFRKEYITTFASNNGMRCTIKEQSSSTSNILFILEK